MHGGFSAIYNTEVVSRFSDHETGFLEFTITSLFYSANKEDLFMIHAYARHNALKPDMARETMF